MASALSTLFAVFLKKRSTPTGKNLFPMGGHALHSEYTLFQKIFNAPGSPFIYFVEKSEDCLPAYQSRLEP